MLHAVRVANFKAIGPGAVSLDLAPLTLVVGPNGAGKTSFLQAIALAAQSARNPSRIGLVADGPLVALDDRDGALYHERRADRPIHIGLTWAPQGSPTRIGAWFEVVGAGPHTPGRWRQGLTADRSSITFERADEAAGNGTRARMTGDPQGEVFVQPDLGQFLGAGLFSTTDPKGSGVAIWKTRAEQLIEWLRSDQLRHIDAVRGGPLFATSAQGTRLRVGRYGEDAIHVLSRFHTRGSPERRALLEKWAARFGLPSLAAGYAGESQLEATFRDPITRTNVDVRNAGFGSQQALPILVELVEMSAGGTLLVEELAQSSHPEWLRLWGQTLVEAIQHLNVQIVATTHAPDLVLAVGLALREAKAERKMAIVHELVRDEGGVRATARVFDSLGSISGGWLESFAHAEKDLLGTLLTGRNGETKKARRKASR